MLRLRSLPVLAAASPATWYGLGVREFGTGNVLMKKPMPPRPPLPDESEFTEVFLRGSGPGGQKINKTSSAVQLKHIPTGIVLKVQETRSRSQNRKIAREKLALKLEDMEKGAQSRTAVVTAVKQKRKSSAAKKSRRKYKALEAEKAASKEEGTEIDLVDEEDDADNGEAEEKKNSK